jgi:hypothetical protein
MREPEKSTSKHEIPKQNINGEKKRQKAQKKPTYLGSPFDDVDGGEMCGM